MVDVERGKGPIRTRLGIDTYATMNTVGERLVERLKLEPNNDGKSIQAHVFEAEQTVRLSGDYVTLPIKHALRGREPIMIKAFVVKRELPFTDHVLPASVRRDLGDKFVDIVNLYGPVEVFI